MPQEYDLGYNDVTMRNLNELSLLRSVLDERRILELGDIASAMVESSVAFLRDGLSMYEVLSFLSEGVATGDYPIHLDHEADLTESLAAASRITENLDRAILSGMYVDTMRAGGYSISEPDFLPSKETRAVFTYVRNQFSDEAYDVFSQDYAAPTVRYSGNFKECVQKLFSGDAGFCLLPLEEKGGVRLHSVAELIFRHDLKINSVTPVFGFDANADLKYALVSGHFTVPARADGDDRYLEVRITATSFPSISDIMSAASALGMTVYRVSTFTFNAEGEDTTFFSLVLRDGGRDFTPFLAYLALFAPDAVPIGMYKNLE